MRHHRLWRVAFTLAASLTLAGCATGPSPREEALHAAPVQARQGPAWLDSPCVGMPEGSVCATASSSLAALDLEAARSDAETAAMARLAKQLRAFAEQSASRTLDVLRTSEASSSTLSLSDAASTRAQQLLVGARISDYHYEPDRSRPQTVHVRVLLDQDVPRQMLETLLAEAKRQRVPVTPAGREQLKKDLPRILKQLPRLVER